jgi:hypothetical protein
VNAARVTVELRRHRRTVATKVTNLDYRDDTILRATLEQMVEDRVGTLKVDLSEWSLAVRSAKGTVIARVTITPAGATEVTR